MKYAGFRFRRGRSKICSTKRFERRGTVWVQCLRWRLENVGFRPVILAQAVAFGRGFRLDQWRTTYVLRAVYHEGEVLELDVT